MKKIMKIRERKRVEVFSSVILEADNWKMNARKLLTRIKSYESRHSKTQQLLQSAGFLNCNVLPAVQFTKAIF